jgi:hypothetical protein
MLLSWCPSPEDCHPVSLARQLGRGRGQHPAGPYSGRTERAAARSHCSSAALATPTTAAYVPAFAAVFRWTVPFMALALILALAMREKPLSEEMIEVAKGEADIPEY